MQREHSDEHKKLCLNIAYYQKEKKILNMQLAKNKYQPYTYDKDLEQ